MVFRPLDGGSIRPWVCLQWKVNRQGCLVNVGDNHICCSYNIGQPFQSLLHSRLQSGITNHPMKTSWSIQHSSTIESWANKTKWMAPSLNPAGADAGHEAVNRYWSSPSAPHKQCCYLTWESEGEDRNTLSINAQTTHCSLIAPYPSSVKIQISTYSEAQHWKQTHAES